MRIIEITESMGQNLANACEDALRANGRLMSCVEEVMRNNGSVNERSGMGMRESMDMRWGMGMRDGGRYGMRSGYDPRFDPSNGYGDRWNPSMPPYYMGERRGNY